MESHTMKKKRGRKPKVRDYYEGVTRGKRGSRTGEGDKGGMRERAKSGQQQPVDNSYSRWKNVVSVIYNWLTNHNLVWPSLSCRVAIVILRGLKSLFFLFRKSQNIWLFKPPQIMIVT